MSWRILLGRTPFGKHTSSGRNLPRLPLLPAGLFLFALAIRLAGIGRESFFVDEVLTSRAAAGPVLRHIAEVENNPPLYFLFIRAWGALFGRSHEALRIPSALAGAAAAPLVWAAARRMGAGAGAPVFAGILMAVSPMGVWHGRQARAYAVVSAAAAAWLWLAAGERSRPTRRGAAGIFALLTAGMGLHYYFPFAAGGGVLAIAAAAVRDERGGANRRLLKIHLAAMAIWPLLLPLLAAQTKRQDYSTIPRPSAADLANVFRRSYVFGPWIDPRPAELAAAGGLAAAMLILLAWIALRRGRRAGPEPFWAGFLLVSLVFSSGVPFLISQGSRSIFLADRYPVISLPFFCLAAALAPAAIRPGWPRRALAAAGGALLLAAAARSNHRYWTSLQDFDWRGAARLLAAEARPGDAALFLPAWLSAPYQSNGGTALPAAAPAAVPEGRIWMFRWEQDPDPAARELAGRLAARPGAEIRIDFGHLRLWEIPAPGSPASRN